MKNEAPREAPSPRLVLERPPPSLFADLVAAGLALALLRAAYVRDGVFLVLEVALWLAAFVGLYLAFFRARRPTRLAVHDDALEYEWRLLGRRFSRRVPFGELLGTSSTARRALRVYRRGGLSLLVDDRPPYALTLAGHALPSSADPSEAGEAARRALDDALARGLRSVVDDSVERPFLSMIQRSSFRHSKALLALLFACALPITLLFAIHEGRYLEPFAVFAAIALAIVIVRRLPETPAALEAYPSGLVVRYLGPGGEALARRIPLRELVSVKMTPYSKVLTLRLESHETLELPLIQTSSRGRVISLVYQASLDGVPIALGDGHVFEHINTLGELLTQRLTEQSALARKAAPRTQTVPAAKPPEAAPSARPPESSPNVRPRETPSSARSPSPASGARPRANTPKERHRGSERDSERKKRKHR